MTRLALAAFVGLLVLSAGAPFARSEASNPALPFDPRHNGDPVRSETKWSDDNAKPDTQVLHNLTSGWNLIVLDVTPEDRTPESVFWHLDPGGSDRVQYVWSYDSVKKKGVYWRNPKPGQGVESPPGVAGLARLAPGVGYWVLLGPDPKASLTVSGRRDLGGPVTYHPGWNLVGFGGATPTEPPIDLDTLFAPGADASTRGVSRVSSVMSPGSEVAAVWTPGAASAKPGEGAGNAIPDSVGKTVLSEVEPGRGYWVQVSDGPLLTLAPCLSVSASGSEAKPGEPVIIKIEEGSDHAQLLLRNSGTGILSWRARVDRDTATWVTITPQDGRIVRETAAVNIKFNRGAAGHGLLEKQFTLVSGDGNPRMVRVQAEVPDLAGDYAGRASMKEVNGKAIDMPSVDLFISLERAADGTLRGVISKAGSLSMPNVDVPLAGADVPGTSSFILAGAYRLRARNRDAYDVNEFNPLPNELLRELSFVGKRCGDGSLDGELTDVLHGVLHKTPITIKGHFKFPRLALAPTHCPKLVAEWTEREGVFGAAEKRLFPLEIPAERRVLCGPVRVEVVLDHPDPSVLDITLIGYNGKRVMLLKEGSGVSSPQIGDWKASWPNESTPVDVRNALKKTWSNQVVERPDDTTKWQLEVTDHSKVPLPKPARMKSIRVEFQGPTVLALRGTILGADGKPQGNADVFLSGGSPPVRTKADGRFAFDRLSTNLYKLKARAAGSGEAEYDIFLEETKNDLKVTLPAANVPAGEADGVGRPEARRLPGIPESLAGGMIVGLVASPPETRVAWARDAKGTWSFSSTGKDTGYRVAEAAPGESVDLGHGRVVTPGLGWAGGGVIPGRYGPGQVTLNASMVDAANFDNHRVGDPLKDGVTFPATQPNSPEAQGDTDVVLVRGVPVDAFPGRGNGKISLNLLGPDGKGDGHYAAAGGPNDRLGPPRLRLVSSVGSWICSQDHSEFGGMSFGGPMGNGDRQTGFGLVVGGHPMPLGWGHARQDGGACNGRPPQLR